MKNPFRRRKAEERLTGWLALALADERTEIRQLFARVARSEAKNFFALQTGNNIEIFERELAARSARALASLGSAALDQHAADAIELTAEQRSVADAAIEKAVRKVHKIPDDEPLSLCLTNVCPLRFATCSECIIPNKENL